uniref:ALA-interacting subunit n=1 Tax=Medicago truncatula TaxID=3880 RepID=I3SLE6_MEDTR|nr:unknown [Medicago truncatula]
MMDMTSSKDGQSPPNSKKTSKKPKYSKFSQQELPAWKPFLTPGWVIATFTAIGIIFIPIGLASLFSSGKVVEAEFRYDETCLSPDVAKDAVAYIKSDTTNKTCTHKWIVEQKMQAPVFIYYQLENYYQNHRRYVKSRNDKQLWRKSAELQTDHCDPVDKTEGKEPIVPCGLIAWSMFNDTYKFSIDNKDLTINKKNIAWGSDKNSKFGHEVYPKNFQSGGLIGGAKLNESVPLSEQEDLIVWDENSSITNVQKTVWEDRVRS